MASPPPPPPSGSRHSPTAGLQHTSIIPTTPTTVRLLTASHGGHAVNAYLGCPPFFLAHGEADTAGTTESLRRARTGQFCAPTHTCTKPMPTVTQSPHTHSHIQPPYTYTVTHTQPYTAIHTLPHDRLPSQPARAQKQPLRTRTRPPRCSRGGVVVSRPLRHTSTAIASPSARLP